LTVKVESIKRRRRLASAGLPLLLLAAIPFVTTAEVQVGHNGHIVFDPDVGENGQYSLYLDPAGAPIKTVEPAEVERSLSTAICAECHLGAIDSLKDSVHFSVQGPNPRIGFPGGGAHGALDRACGLPGTTALINYNSDINLGECGKCHVGRFIPPMEGAFTSMFDQMGLPDPAGQAKDIVDGGLDCLICHAEHYLAVRDDLDWSEGSPIYNTHQIAGYGEPGEHSPSPQGYAKLTRDNTDFDHDGQYDPLVDVTGEGDPDICLPVGMDDQGMPICGWPTVGQDRSVAAVLSVGTSDEHNCLRCHEHARTGYKRGTLFREGYDVHATVCFDDGEGGCVKNTCTACHRADSHKFVRGHLVGGDLAAADYPPPPPGVAPDPEDETHLTCVQCHDPDQLPHKGDGGNPGVHSDTHLALIACETCHITKSGGITYSMYGHGGHISFGRNADGLDTKVITLDHMVADESSETDVDDDFAAYSLTPVLMWFDGQTSFLAQSMAVRGAPNAQIVPFKPMANGMVMDGRFFAGEMLANQDGEPYNAHSMYRFYANALDCEFGVDQPCSPDGKYGNAEVFTALKLLGTITDSDGNVIVEGLTPEQVRKVWISDLFAIGQTSLQTMAMMQAFPNLMNFSKMGYMYEHYLVSTALAGELEDQDGNGVLDEDVPFLFDMLAAVNTGLEEFKGFNTPMFLPPDYDWYPEFGSVKDVATMKLPDGSFIKLFLSMGIQQQLMEQLPQDQWDQIPGIIQGLVGNYPAFSNGVTLGGHGVTPDPKTGALGGPGRGGCAECHGEDGVLTTQVPVTQKELVDVPFPPPMDKAEMPVWRWVYYNVKELLNLGLKTENADIVAGTADVDIADEPNGSDLVRKSRRVMILNWFDPSATPTYDGERLVGYRPFTPADSGLSRFGTRLRTADLTWNGGDWMPVLEPVTSPAPNYAVLGYQKDEVIFDTAGGGGGPGPGGPGGGGSGGG
jgi:hypothetical protein